ASRLPEAPSEPHLLIHFNEGTTEIGVCHQGRLLLDYRPGGATRPGELPALLAGHFNRLNRHVARALRESATELKQVLLCGPAAEVASASGQFERQLGLQTRIVNPADVRATWDLSAAAAEAITAPVLGGLLLSYMPTEEWDAPNLMQHVLAGRQEPLRPRLIASALPLAATLLIAVALMAVNGRHRRVLDGMRAEADSLAVSAARATELRLRLITAEAKLTQLGQLAARLPGALAGEAIRRIGWCLPSDVWLSQVTVAQGTRIRLTGASYLEAGVYDFVRWLELAPGFKEVALKRTSATVGATGPATSFEVELSLGDFNDQAPRMARHD
ncbi:MAG TPA: PilN domain-containing protein, partial [Lacipirellulaceae bacterium]|nr:PilN domain-containing protein [Lacipirellulaceae bacterium]